MIALLHGVLAERGPGRVVVMASGVGYEALVPSSTLDRLPSTGSEVRLLTRMQMRDDALVLFGFATREERDLFDRLVTVTGVGPKLALTVLSSLTPTEFVQAVVSEDVPALCTVPGIGKKVAGRIVLDLKDSLGVDALPGVAHGPLAEVREALLTLGLSPDEARTAVSGLDASGEVEDLLRQALQAVGRG